jgi:hypothetical protein
VVAADGHFLDRPDRHAQLGGQLTDGTVVVQPGHRGKLPGIDLRRRGLGDEGIGVGGITDDEDLDAATGVISKSCRITG